MQVLPGSTPKATTCIPSTSAELFWTFLGQIHILQLPVMVALPHIWLCSLLFTAVKLLWDSVAGVPIVTSHVSGRGTQVLPQVDFLHREAPLCGFTHTSWPMLH